MSARKGLRIVGFLVAAALIAAGNAVMHYPELSDFLYQQSVGEQCAVVDEAARQMGVQAAEVQDDGRSGSASSSKKSDSAEKLAACVKRLKSYNEKARMSREGAVGDPFMFPPVSGQLDGVLLEEGLLGYIRIPAMECRLPLYYGSTEANMAKGATVVEGTTVPLDEAESNCVIAAHRGYAQSKMFRDIEVLKRGDMVEVVTFWGTYWYRVRETEVILPSDVSAVMPEKGRDEVSLITCHPYPSNSHRYLVRCERTDAPEGKAGASGEVGQAKAGTVDFETMLSDASQTEKLVKWLVTAFSIIVVVVMAIRLVKCR